MLEPLLHRIYVCALIFLTALIFLIAINSDCLLHRNGSCMLQLHEYRFH